MLKKLLGVFILSLVCNVFIFSNAAFSLEILSPHEGDVIESGQILLVRVGASPGERIEEVIIGGDKLKNFDIARAPSFEGRLFISPGILGRVLISAVGAKNQDGSLPGTATVSINVVLPQSVMLQSLRVDSDQSTIYSEIGDRKKLYVYGKFSDGVERLISVPDAGTSYSIDNEAVAAITSDGIIEAKAAGKANVTVRNNNQQLQIRVIVKAKQ